MKNPLRGTSYANVVASLALVVALGGTGYAAATIGTNDIKNNAVTSPKIKDKTISNKDVKKDAINSAKLKDNGVREPDVADIKMQDLPLLNGWVPYNSDRGVKFGKTADGLIVLSGGVVQSGVFNSAIGELPPGYRPIDDYAWLTTNTVNASGPARIDVGTDGIVYVEVAAPNTEDNAAAFTSLDGLTFVR